MANYKTMKLNADVWTPVGIFQRLAGKKKFLLESTLPHEVKGKFSFIGTNPYEELIGDRGQTIVRNLKTGDSQEFEKDVLEVLKDRLPALEIDLPLPFFGGAIGYIGYDEIRQFENIGEVPADDLKMPDVHLMLYENIFIFDHKDETVHLVAINTGTSNEAELDSRLEELASMLDRKPEHTGDLESTEFTPEISAELFKANVEKAKEYIHQGDIFQVVLSQRLQAEFKGEPFSFYRKLRRSNPSPYMFYVDFADYLVLGASPESLLQTKGSEIITNPIAGTRPRSKDPQEDARLEAELLADEKEIAEHKMLIDLGRNDLGRVCEIGSVKVPTYMKIERYEHVMHIVSEVSGKLRKDFSSIDALISCLPAGTVSGAPKIRAMQIINELESKRRGVYAGGIGYIGFNGDLNMALAIRSLVVKDATAYLQAGAGIVFDSQPQKEYEETLHKARSLMEVSKIDLVN
ncbi:anthranilate synthase component I [Aciduricibacillus chroicocephali]|uniref:Anthranilate synthase component 1 n=1 Tax=Aciduricibacillus chroicocephali TaxID=3054939 RepID=A0ABY9KZR5_9BACI|nr:anthranilate synthase component I [Bacillaceae bacterium 44XB]